jgi:hypothetical protein
MTPNLPHMLVAVANAHPGMLLHSLLLYFFLNFPHLALHMKWLICPHLNVEGGQHSHSQPQTHIAVMAMC